MDGDRLTRQELSWLLAQEARTAAEFLRKGVTQQLTVEPLPDDGDDVTSTLDVLDDAMRTLASLNTTGGIHNSRRGRMDLAAMLLELAPAARVELEPGGGTEVFGDEGEFRRMLQVLLSFGTTAAVHSEGTTNQTTIRREGGDVRVTVALGPDSSATGATEYVWLQRMATRYRGSIVLEGGQISLRLPANAAIEREELEELRRELIAAQERGESYARELAAVFAQRRSMPPGLFSRLPPPRPIDDRFVWVARVFAALAQPHQQGLAAERIKTLAGLARFLIHEVPEGVALATLMRSATDSLQGLVREKGVTLVTNSTDDVAVLARRGAAALLSLLIEQAVQASPSGGLVRIEASTERDGVCLCVQDAGPVVDSVSQGALLRLELDGQSVGRPADVELFCADALTRHLGGVLEVSSHDALFQVKAVLPAPLTINERLDSSAPRSRKGT